MSEKWLTIEEFPKYEVSNLGRVRFKKNKRIRSLVPDDQEYLRINLKKKKDITDKKVTTFCRLVHRLVAKAFIGPRPLGYQINHKDLDKSNNSVSNLEYVTPKENQQHSKDLDANNRGSRHGNSKLTEKQVLEIRAKLNVPVDFAMQRKIAREYGIHVTTLRGIQKRESWKHI